MLSPQTKLFAIFSPHRTAGHKSCFVFTNTFHCAVIEVWTKVSEVKQGLDYSALLGPESGGIYLKLLDWQLGERERQLLTGIHRHPTNIMFSCSVLFILS